MSDRAFIHQPFNGHIRMKPTGVLMAKLKGEAGFINVGDYESVSYSIEIEEEDIYSPQAPERVKIATLPTESSISLSFELSQLTDMFRAIAYASDSTLTFEQPAVVDRAFEFIDLKPGHIVPTGFKDVTEIEIPGYDLGVHFQFDGPAGNLEIIAHPDGAAKANVEGLLSAKAITGRQVWGMLQNTDIRGSLMFRSTNKYGPKQLVEFHDVKFRADGDQTLGSNSTDWANVSFTGEVFADATQPLEYAYGRVTDLPAAA